MRLAKLTVSGFKSFADTTEFTFDDQVTGIVGPNGCGKSNVVDAIKWVLGERSAKSLRGKEMMDVIFAGSAGRKPAGMASVVLTFDNPELSRAEAEQLDTQRADDELAALEHDLAEPEGEASGTEDDGDEKGVATVTPRRVRRRALAIDAEQVDIERRLYRDGTSQYLINNRRVRMRDIRELFMDTGVGAHAYSIIEQGKVDAMLLANPVERRIFFEEAAGVARFKARRVESIRKLERAETNLVRVREQLDSTERRLRIVRGQASKARTFRVLDAEYRGVRTALAFHQFDDLQRQLWALTSRLAGLSKELAHARDTSERMQGERQECDAAREEAERERRVHMDARIGAEHRAESARQRLAMTERQLEEDERRIVSDSERATTLTKRVDTLGADAEDRAGVAENLAAALAATERSLGEASEARQRALDDLTEQRHALATVQTRLGALEREQAQCETRAQSERERAAQAREQATSLSTKSDELRRSLEGTRDELAAARSGCEALGSSVGDAEEEIDRLVRTSEELGAEQRELAESLNTMERERARLDSRRSTLEEMAESRVGFGEAVKRVLARRDEDRTNGGDHSLYARVHAPLAELLHVDVEFAPAVEAALGSLLQALVIDRVDPRLDRDAIDELSGRVTFLPLEAAPSTTTPTLPELPDAMGTRVRALRGCVTCDEAVRPLLDRLLATAVLVPDLDSAAMLAMGPLHGSGARFVTESGEVLEPDGGVVAGPVGSGGEGSGAGMLQRAAELVTLRERIEALRVQIDGLQDRTTRLDASSAALHEDLAQRRHGLAQRQRELVTRESTVERLAAELGRLEQTLPEIDQERDGAMQKAERAEQEAATLDARLGTLRDDADTVARERSMVEDALRQAGERAEGAGDRLTAARVESSQQGEQLSSVRRELRRIDAEATESRRELERLLAHLGERRMRLDEHRATIASSKGEIEGAEAERVRAAEGVERHDARLREVVTLLEEVNARLHDAHEHTRTIDRDFQSIELTKRELEVRRETLEDRSLEELALDLTLEYGAYRLLMRDGDVLPIEPDEVSAEVEDLRTRIKKLGNVNLDAIEEESNLSERNEELIAQVADIDRARGHLEELITRLSDVSRERFRETFERIEGHFAGKDGMFRRLFGGGRADVRMIPDPETGEVDWLESGVEVIAKPPGKEPRSISQLSGGEKTMAAVALLLSIFQSKPSPFCVLDEVDAALDDANVDRFGSIVRQFTDSCDFIVITHNKRTMHVCDRLYGVTMQERGVSTRVSVRFEEVGNDGRLKGDAAKRSADERVAAQVEAKPARAETASA